MELRIEITKENREKIFRLIGALLEEEDMPSGVLAERIEAPRNYLRVPDDMNGLEEGHVMKYGTSEDVQLQLIGTWGQFNSFFPVKAALRILANLLQESKTESVNLRNLVFKCIDIFRKVKVGGKILRKYRGFPLRRKDSATGRFVWHFLTPAQEMGLIKITNSALDYNGNPYSPNDWEKVDISITKDGLDFARLENPLFDHSSRLQVFGVDERKWLINYLQKVDQEGFKEFSLLKDVSEFLAEGHNGKEDLWSWFEHDQRLIKYVNSWSRKLGKPEKLRKQIENLSRTFSSSKIALLRELGIVKNKRNDYTVIREF